MLSETDVVNGYMWILGRLPGPEEIAAYRRPGVLPDEDPVREFQDRLLCSEEFRLRRMRIARLQRLTAPELGGMRIAFVHVEKCAGTTLHAMLATQFDPAEVCPERHETLADWTGNELARFRLFSGHFDLAACAVIPGEVRVLTMLREPRARLLSLYRFWRAHRPHPERDRFDLLRMARTLDPEAFFGHEAVRTHPSIRDAMAGQLIRRSKRLELAADDPLLRDPDMAGERAWRALRGMAGFGIVERFEDSRLLLNRQLGLRMAPTAPLQVLDRLARTDAELTDTAPVADTPRLRRLLDQLTTIDRSLYARAASLFEARMRDPAGGEEGGMLARSLRRGRNAVAARLAS